MCETPLLVSMKAGIIWIIPHENVAEIHACMLAKGSMDVYPRFPFYITFANNRKIEVNLSKRQEIGEAANAQVKIVHVKDERFSYTVGARVNIIDRSVNAEPTPDSLKQIAEHEAAKENDKEKLKKDGRKNVKVFAKLQERVRFSSKCSRILRTFLMRM